MTGQELLVPGTGELVDLGDEQQTVRALQAIRDLEQQLREVKAALTSAIVERARVLGTQTLNLEDGIKAELRGGKTNVYDAQQLEEELRALGLPEERIGDLIKTEITYKVDARVAKQLAAANEQYAAVIESNRREHETPVYVSIKHS